MGGLRTAAGDQMLVCGPLVTRGSIVGLPEALQAAANCVDALVEEATVCQAVTNACASDCCNHLCT